MSSASQLCHRNRQVRTEPIATMGAGAKIWACVQFLWVGVTFLLFLVLGPFAAIAVIPAVFSLAGNLKEAPLPEMESTVGDFSRP